MCTVTVPLCWFLWPRQCGVMALSKVCRVWCLQTYTDEALPILPTLSSHLECDEIQALARCITTKQEGLEMSPERCYYYVLALFAVLTAWCM